ncbi:acyl-CoA synthetase [Pseudoroseomonas wenyumeiae]|uniref:3-methylmercaptopropionyl-CoA ligase n=1 Tax=Teichococcus wenyumeiae TaxID=2478470 RepID=A0A3A9JLZ9_9PROT|nr:AMP-binding protein [Pseudoroseomonas wenyumeiae]RKK04754.1 acyl-CoA synthetase [Pseudoroseomonas wenyumeiae]RMI26972.1 acyl-CoA synthetase [Pseudoroseomonas wenyumeiae]
MTARDYDALPRTPANHVPLTPLLFTERSAAAFPDRVAVVHGAQRWTWKQHRDRCVQLASALNQRGIGRGDTVAVLLPNTPAMVECHTGVPMSGAVLGAINIRLDAETIAYILDHGEAKLVIADRELLPLLEAALALTSNKPPVIEVNDPEAPFPHTLGGEDYETVLASGDADFAWPLPADEWDAIALNYTSGTTGRPKGVVYHHRGAHLSAIGDILACQMAGPPTYLWTLPMFHCNGWCFPWVVAALSGTNVCLRAVRGPAMWEAITTHGVTHMCGAPIVLSTLLDTPNRPALPGPLRFMVAGAPPPEAVLAKAADAGITVVHIYGLTECYGPAVVNEWKPEDDAKDGPTRAALMARQGLRYVTLEALDVFGPDDAPVPADGTTMGEVVMRGNMVAKGYLKDPAATEKALAGGWFRTGDLGVKYPDGYVQVKDRAKDIIISGGENISSIEVEEALYRHPAVAVVAVIAMPDEKWGEVPCAFVELRPDTEATEAELIAFTRTKIAGYKAPKRIVFGEVPKTSTGKLQKAKLRATVREAV